MRILVLFASSEGHTRQLAGVAAERLKQRGHDVCLCDAGGHPDLPDPAEFEAAILMASVHVGRYQAPLVSYARKNHQALNTRPSAFVSVSLSASGHNTSDSAGLLQCVERLKGKTLWRPSAVHHAA